MPHPEPRHARAPDSLFWMSATSRMVTCRDVPNRGSVRDYQELSASFGCMAVLVTARRSVGSPVYFSLSHKGAKVCSTPRSGIHAPKQP